MIEGRYSQAEAEARDRLAHIEVMSGRDTVAAAQVLDVLVDALWRGGKVAQPETRTLAERAVAIKERALGPEHPDLADSLHNLAWLEKDTGNYAGAKPLFERALAIREKALGPDHPDIADILNGLGVMLTDVGDYVAARPVLERALTIREWALGPHHRSVGASVNNLANLFVSMGDYAQARSAYERVVAILERDIFISKVSADGSTLVYSTFLGGNRAEISGGIDGRGGSVYVTGRTVSTDFPTTEGAYDRTCGTDGDCNQFDPPLYQPWYDAFVSKLTPAGTGTADLIHSTYLGGSAHEAGLWSGGGIAVDAAGRATVTGTTVSFDFPTLDPFQATHAGGIWDVFVTKLNTAGSALIYSTYLGGSGADEAQGIDVDQEGLNAYVIGRTASPNFPTANPLQPSYAGGAWDAFVTRIRD